MDPPQETEAELERFRRQWQEEVSRRAKQSASQSQSQSNNNVPSVNVKPERRKQQAGPSSSSVSASEAVPSVAHKTQAARPAEGHDGHEEDQIAQSYHDLPDKETDLRLDAADHGFVRGASSAARVEPKSALEHYERAVEKETTGSLGDSLLHYRKAFKLDDNVHEQYKQKHFPPSSFPKRPPPPPQSLQKPAQANNQSSSSQAAPSNATASQPTATAAAPTSSLEQLIADFSTLSIPGAPPPTDADPPPPCPIANLPAELLTDILKYAAINDLSSLSRIAQVCKRLAHLVMTDEQVWRRIAQGPEYGFAAMHYDYVCDQAGQPLPDDYADVYANAADDDEEPLPAPPRALAKTTPEIDAHLLASTFDSSWRNMFRRRPRLRFNGCYISTVNYTRPGAASTDSRTWGTPIHIVTYFRYLRFFRDGTVISLLTTTEPVDVVHHLTKENLPTLQPRERDRGKSSVLPVAVMKDALRGRWRLSGPGPLPSSSADTTPDDQEEEGEVHIETEGVVPKYMWKMQFSLASAGRKDGARNNKLAWIGFWGYNKLTDDWGEFGLKNDKAFYFSRVKAYGMAY